MATPPKRVMVTFSELSLGDQLIPLSLGLLRSLILEATSVQRTSVPSGGTKKVPSASPWLCAECSKHAQCISSFDPGHPWGSSCSPRLLTGVELIGQEGLEDMIIMGCDRIFS